MKYYINKMGLQQDEYNIDMFIINSDCLNEKEKQSL